MTVVQVNESLCGGKLIPSGYISFMIIFVCLHWYPCTCGNCLQVKYHVIYLSCAGKSIVSTNLFGKYFVKLKESSYTQNSAKVMHEFVIRALSRVYIINMVSCLKWTNVEVLINMHWNMHTKIRSKVMPRLFIVQNCVWHLLLGVALLNNVHQYQDQYSCGITNRKPIKLIGFDKDLHVINW